MIRSKNKLIYILLQIILAIICSYSMSSGASWEILYISDSPFASIQLPHQNIFAESVMIKSGSKVLDIIDRIDYRQGIVYLKDSLPANQSFQVYYEYLSYSLPEYVFKRKLQPDNQTEPIVQTPDDIIVPKKNKQTSSKAFLLSGSKSISVSAGNVQDLDLNQRLNLRISGEPVKGLHIVGSLTDRAQPQAGGISSALEDIESISLLATARNFKIELGDINYRNQWGGIAEFSKKIKGVDANFNGFNLDARATVSSLKGKYKTVSFFALDGVSGPYNLKNETGSRTSIIGGTEKVYLDGQQLKEGASEDYLIDYALGEITFNPRISLTSRSRIVVDYEYLDQSYRRNFYSGELSYGLLSNKLKISTGFMEQFDSRDNPVNFIFSSDDLDVLRSSGDNQDMAVTDGAVFVGDGNGNYTISIDIFGNTFYTYVGDSLGNHNVRFTRVAANQGDYSFLGGGKYIYKGKNQGNYLPFEYLVLPSVSRGIYFGTELDLGKHAQFDLKLSASDNDVNSFSDVDDTDNNGFLGEMSLLFRPLDSAGSVRLINDLKTGIKIKTQEKSFSLPGRSEIAELNRKWALGTDSIYERADQYEISQTLEILKILNINTELGHLDDGDDISSDRNQIDLILKPHKYLDFNLSRDDRISKIDPDSNSNRIYSDLISTTFRLNGFKWTAGWEDESDNRALAFLQSPGARYDRYFSDINYSGARLSVSRRDQSRLNYFWQDEYSDLVVSTGLTRSILKGSLSIEAGVTRRKVEYAGDSIPDFSETRSLSKLSFRGPSGLFSGYVSYRLNRQLITRLARNFIKVEEGQGDYRLEDTVYVRDDFGDYIAVDELIDAGDAGLSSEKSMNLKVDLTKILPELKNVKQLYSEFNLNQEEQGAGGYRLNLLYALPFWKVYPDDDLLSRQEFRQIISLSTNQGYRISVGFEENQTCDKIRDLSSERYRRLLYERVYLVFNQTFNLKLEHRFKRERESSGYFGTADFSEHDISVELLFYSGRNFELKIKPRYLVDMGKSDDLSVTLLGGQISPALSFAGKGRVTVDLSYLRVTEKEDRFIPYQFALGNRPGDNLKWGASINYKYNKFITAGLKYSADKVPGLAVRHKLSFNMKANF